MCGIAGILDIDDRAHATWSEIDRMCGAMLHRGPDDQGIYVHHHVGLGMRRLSIIDLVTGQQPIHNEDGTVWVVFNGEIYNYQELRSELEQAGHRFYTHSDTEVLPHLYEELGPSLVSKLRGMFALALYDERRQSLLLARDRLGKKPLLYAATPQRLIFASEARAILAVAPELAEADPEALLSFFHFGYIPDPKSGFTGIRKLPPGHTLEAQRGNIKISPYWDLPAFTEDAGVSEEEWLERLEHELSAAVRMRLISHVPIGAMLSGGVDSSTVVALMARAHAGPVKTFSISFDEGDFDEGQHALRVARAFATEHHRLTMKPDFHETLEKLTGLLEEPFGDSSMLPTYYVSRLVRQHVTVALSGDGGDELFAGYDRYAIHQRRNRFGFMPSWAGHLYRRWVYPSLPEALPGRRFLYNVSLPSRDRYLDSISYLPVEDRERSLFSDDWLAFALQAESPCKLFQSLYDRAPATDPLSRLQYLDAKTYLPGDILAKVDRMSMANSLETRAPMLDHVFVELASRIPWQWKVKHGESKYILKRLALRLGVPREVVYRPKKGFGVPLVHWFRRELKSGMLAILTEPKTLQRGYFRPAAVRRLVDEHLRGSRDRSAAIWLLLVFELWHRNFLEPLSAQGSAFLQSSDFGFRSQPPSAAPGCKVAAGPVSS